MYVCSESVIRDLFDLDLAKEIGRAMDAYTTNSEVQTAGCRAIVHLATGEGLALVSLSVWFVSWRMVAHQSMRCHRESLGAGEGALLASSGARHVAPSRRRQFAAQCLLGSWRHR